MISIRLDTKELEQRLGEMSRKLPVVVRNLTNDLAFEVRTAEIAAITRIFPTANPSTKKNIWVKKATTGGSNPFAVIQFDQIYRKGVDEYMLPNVEGGQRVKKPSEQRLGQFYVPGMGAKLNQYGNMKGGYVTQILSQLGRFGDVSGYDMNQTAKSRKLSRTGSKSTEYFIITRQRGGLRPGVYQRTQKQGGFTSVGAPKSIRGQQGRKALQAGVKGPVQGRGAVPVMVFVKQAPKYKAVWPFFKIAQDVIDTRTKPLGDYYIQQMLQG